MSAERTEDLLTRLEADLARGDQLILSASEFRRIRGAIADGEYAKRLIREARERALDGADLYEAFPTIFGSKPQGHPNSNRDVQRIAMHYRYLTGQVGAWACYDRVDSQGKRRLPWAEQRHNVSKTKALEIISGAYSFPSLNAAWTCIDQYRQMRRKAVADGDLVTADRPEWIELPTRLS